MLTNKMCYIKGMCCLKKKKTKERRKTHSKRFYQINESMFFFIRYIFVLGSWNLYKNVDGLCNFALNRLEQYSTRKIPRNKFRREKEWKKNKSEDKADSPDAICVVVIDKGLKKKSHVLDLTQCFCYSLLYVKN